MRSSRLLAASTVACATLCAAGCFGDNSGGGPPAIMSVEPPAQGVDAEGGRAPVHIRVKGQRDEQLTIALTSTLGTFTPEQEVLITDAEGLASYSPEFVAGAESGEAMAVGNVADLDGERVSFELSFPVVPLSRVGEVAQLPNLSTVIAANYLEGQSITLAAAGKLRRVGIVAPTETNVAVGIYTDVAGVPTKLLASASTRLKVGVNELPVDAVELAAGTYWFMSNYDSAPTAPRLYRSSTVRPLKYIMIPFSTTLPTAYPAAYSSTTEPLRNCYLVLGR